MCFRIFLKNRTGNFELTSDAKKKVNGTIADSLALNFADRETLNELSQINENKSAAEVPISIENKSLLNNTQNEIWGNNDNKTLPPRHTNDNPRRKKMPKRRAPQPPITENNATKTQVFLELDDGIKNGKATEEKVFEDNLGSIKYNSTNSNTIIEVEDNTVQKETDIIEHLPETSTNTQEREAEKMAGVSLAINNKESIILNEDSNSIEKSEVKTLTDEEFPTAINIEEPLFPNAINSNLEQNEIETNDARELPLAANIKFSTILGADSHIEEKNKVKKETTGGASNVLEPTVSNTEINILHEMEDGKKSAEEAPYAVDILDQRAFVTKSAGEPIFAANIREPVLSNADSKILEVICKLEEEAEKFQYKIEHLTEDVASTEKYYIEESITRIILKLDNLDDDHSQAVTLKKKQLIKFTHDLFKRFDEKTGHT